MSHSAIEGLKPELLWEHFYKFTQTPRPSKKEEKARELVKKFAEENNFKFDEDLAGNIVVHVPATPGYENAPTVVIQGHIDMVCEKNKGTEHDFENDPLKIKREGDWITAEGTTLGADNAIGVAAGMAAALDPEAVHGPMELLCTVDEETGMTGVSGLQPGFIKGKYLLNLDSEEDGVFYVGCAGGQDTVGVMEIDWRNNHRDMVPYEIMVTGLKGGHSGLDIHQGRGNAIKILAYLLNRFESIKYRVFDISGGSLRNAIPREAEVKLIIDPDDIHHVEQIIEEFEEEMKLELKVTDPGLKIRFTKLDTEVEKSMRKKFFKTILNVLTAIPHGVIAYNPEIDGLVDTSTNLATVKVDGNVIRIGTSQRSSIESAKTNVTLSVASVFSLAGAEVKIGDGYPGWTPNMDSELLKTCKGVYKELFGAEPEIKAIHAGLETGLLGAKYPGLDMISFGPTIQGAHSPDERVSIPDVEKFYTLLKGVLKELTK